MWLVFSSEADRLIVRDQGLDSPERLRVLTDKNVNETCNIARKPCSKNANESPDRGQQVSVIAQEHLKLAVFLFHYQWRSTFDCLLAGQKKLKNEYKDPDVPLKVNKAEIAGTTDSIKEYTQIIPWSCESISCICN